MELCLVRHGIAVEFDEHNAADDGLRPLTRDGREKMARAAAGLARTFGADGIISSPLVRARQTAGILQTAWDKPVLRYSEHLATGDHEALLGEAAGYGWERIALVGHMPHLANLLSLLLTGSRTRLDAEFKRGAAAIVALPDFESALAGGGTLVALLPPGVLRSMRK